MSAIGSVRVVSKRKGGLPAAAGEIVIDGDRSHPVLGNRQVLNDHNDDGERLRVIEADRLDLLADLASSGPRATVMLGLAEQVSRGERLALRCWCAPRPCHLDAIAQEVLRQAQRLAAGEPHDLQRAQPLPAGIVPSSAALAQVPGSSAQPALAKPSGLELFADNSSNYRPRTERNAREADLTIAFAVDFSTAGERLTRRVAGERFVAIDLKTVEEPVQAARQIYQGLRSARGRRINVAGNGIHTLAKHGWSQERINAFVHGALATVHEHLPLSSIRSGGQTGADTAGLVAGVALGVQTIGLYPFGFLQRDVRGEDVRRSPGILRLEIEAAAKALKGLSAAHEQDDERDSQPQPACAPG
jgi:hypothetical protein